MTMNVLAFLNARLDETAKLAAAALAENTTPGRQVDYPYPERKAHLLHDARHSPKNVLADIAAKRKLIDLLFRHMATTDGEWGCSHTADEIKAGQCGSTTSGELEGLYLLAAPFAGHPDYQEAWKP